MMKLPVLARIEVDTRGAACSLPEGRIPIGAILRGVVGMEAEATRLRTTGLDCFLPLLEATAEGLMRMHTYLGRIVGGRAVAGSEKKLELPRWGGLDAARLGEMLMGEGLSGGVRDWRASCGIRDRHVQFQIGLDRGDQLMALRVGAGLSISHIGILSFYQSFWFEPNGTLRSVRVYLGLEEVLGEDGLGDSRSLFQFSLKPEEAGGFGSFLGVQNGIPCGRNRQLLVEGVAPVVAGGETDFAASIKAEVARYLLDCFNRAVALIEWDQNEGMGDVTILPSQLVHDGVPV